LATRVAHRGTGLLSEDEGLDRLLARISADENLHMVLYRDLFMAALEADPAAALHALVEEVAGFTMPGTGIPGFVRRAAVVARAGIYDLRVHRDQVVAPLIRHWKVLDRDLPPAAEVERERLVAVLAELDRRAERVRPKELVASS
ncbi:MAG: acyl-ACP desaturase, partial [Pseudorhodobacter sp.]|nr:acyl-ACP desaturase [Frankiaceae bacterium]